MKSHQNYSFDVSIHRGTLVAWLFFSFLFYVVLAINSSTYSHNVKRSCTLLNMKITFGFYENYVKSNDSQRHSIWFKQFWQNAQALVMVVADAEWIVSNIYSYECEKFFPDFGMNCLIKSKYTNPNVDSSMDWVSMWVRKRGREILFVHVVGIWNWLIWKTKVHLLDGPMNEIQSDRLNQSSSKQLERTPEPSPLNNC